MRMKYNSMNDKERRLAAIETFDAFCPAPSVFAEQKEK